MMAWQWHSCAYCCFAMCWGVAIGSVSLVRVEKAHKNEIPFSWMLFMRPFSVVFAKDSTASMCNG